MGEAARRTAAGRATGRVREERWGRGRAMSRFKTRLPILYLRLSVLPDGEAISTQLTSQLWFHCLPQLVGKRVEVLVEFREEAAPVLPYEPRRVFTALVLSESLVRCDSSHPDVDTQFPWNPVRISLDEPLFPLKDIRI